MEKIAETFHQFRQSKAWQPVKDVLMFAFLLLSFHFIYIFWGNHNFYPFKAQVDQLFIFASDILFNQSVWILQHIFGLDVTTVDQTIYVMNHQGTWSYVEVSPGCTSLKQWMHWIFIMVCFRGPIKHKLWYIPLGIIVIHFVNIIRIVGLSLTGIPMPHHFEFFHNYVFKTFFYFMIFLMWVIWVEVFARKKTEENTKAVTS